MSDKLLLTCVGCGNRGAYGFFYFPKNPSERKIWLQKCGVDVSTPISANARLCIKHFKREDMKYVNNSYRLRKGAVPSIKVDPGKIRKVCRYKHHCYVCGMVYSDSFHAIPKDEKIRVTWLKNLGITFGAFQSVPTTRMRLCNSHFSAGDITWHPYSFNHKLRPGAMPLRKSQNSENNQTGQSAPSSKANCSKESRENSEEISVSREIVQTKGSEGVRVSSTLECELEEKNKRIRRLKEKNARLRKDLTCHQNLLMDCLSVIEDLLKEKKQLKKELRGHLLMGKFVTKEDDQNKP